MACSRIRKIELRKQRVKGLVDMYVCLGTTEEAGITGTARSVTGNVGTSGKKHSSGDSGTESLVTSRRLGTAGAVKAQDEDAGTECVEVTGTGGAEATGTGGVLGCQEVETLAWRPVVLCCTWSAAKHILHT